MSTQRRDLESILSELPLSADALVQLAPVMPHGTLLNAMRFGHLSERLVAAACLSQRYVPFGPPQTSGEDYRTLGAAADLVALALSNNYVDVLLNSDSDLIYVAWLLSGTLGDLPDGRNGAEELSKRCDGLFASEAATKLQRLGISLDYMLADLSRGKTTGVEKVRRALSSSHGPLPGRVIDPSWRHTTSSLTPDEREGYVEIATAGLGTDPYAWLLAHHFAAAWDSSFYNLCATVRLLIDAN